MVCSSKRLLNTQYLSSTCFMSSSMIGPENKEAAQIQGPCLQAGGSSVGEGNVLNGEPSTVCSSLLSRLELQRGQVERKTRGSQARAEGSEQTSGQLHLCPRVRRGICEANQERAARIVLLDTCQALSCSKKQASHKASSYCLSLLFLPLPDKNGFSFKEE